MKEKVVLVTGANGGLGTHVTRAFLRTDATVVGTARTIQTSDFNTGAFTALPGELSTPEGARLVVQQLMDRFGTLDVLVHTVGGFAGGPTVAETDPVVFQRMLDLNLNALFFMLRAAIPPLLKTGNGRVIAVGSRAAIDPGPGVGAYAASKAAMVSLIKTVAHEHKAAGLRANVVLPGTIDTPANRRDMPGADVSKWVRPESIADLILWLAGDAGKDVNGAAIPVYGSD
ncbi:MAG TPA: SDR family NAD(P)-dependent oxidoreductase [Terriglobales bacterium]|nr:SDR family NAD(P)-dependent oxidoreductase [Terriglobales bacterium]